MRRHLIALLLPTLLAAAPSTPPVAEEVLQLPEFKVYATRELPPVEEWLYARVGSLEVLSSASDRNTRRFIRDFTTFQNVLTVIAPNAVLRAELPATAILCGDREDYRKLLPRGRGLAQAFGVTLLTDREIATIALDLERRTIGEPAREVEFEPTAAFYVEYTRLALERAEPGMPNWFREGFARIVGHTEFTDSWIEFGSIKPFHRTGPDSFVEPVIPMTVRRVSGGGTGNYSGRSSIGQPLNGPRGMMEPANYRPMHLMPMDRFFALGETMRSTGSLRGTDEGRTWLRQATAFAHYGLFADNKRHQAGFLKLVQRAVREPVTPELFKECMELDLHKMTDALSSYIGFAAHTYTVLKAKNGTSLADVPDFTLRPATDAEIGRIKGETMRLAGANEAARTEFVTSYLRGARDPQLLASLGLQARQRGETARARTYLEQIAGTDIPRPRAYLELARLRHEEFRAADGGKLTAAHADRVVEPLMAGLRQSPPLPDLYAELARTWLDRGTPATSDELALMQRGVQAFPQERELLFAAADLLSAQRLDADAAQLRERAAQLAAREVTPRETTESSPRQPAPQVGAPRQIGARPAFTGEYFESKEVDRKPVVHGTLAATYTAAAGEPASVAVMLSFLVTAEGRTEQVQVRNAVPSTAAAAAIRAIEGATFTPGAKDGKPVITAVARVLNVTAAR